MQSQAFFTPLIAAALYHERIRPLQIVAILIALAGVAQIGWHTVARPDITVTLRGFLLMMAASLSWSCANLVVKRAGRVEMLGFMVWSSVFAIPPLLALHLLTSAGSDPWQSLWSAPLAAWLVVAWQAIGNTLIGFGIWNWLLMRYPSATVTPLSLLVPVFGMTAAAVLFGETLPAWKLIAGAFVIAGLTLNTVVSRQPR
jgi:O-acetylserine/cysteine efflux transporter